MDQPQPLSSTCHVDHLAQPTVTQDDLAVALGVNVAIYSTPCLFAAQGAIEEALTTLKTNEGRLPPQGIGVTEALHLLERNATNARRLPLV
jgi:hypothetical protein